MAQRQVTQGKPEPPEEEKCPICEKWCGTHVQKHIKMAHWEPDVCSNRSYSRATTPQGNQRECQICGASIHRKSIVRHIEKQHGIVTERKTGRPPKVKASEKLPFDAATVDKSVIEHRSSGAEHSSQFGGAVPVELFSNVGQPARGGKKVQTMLNPGNSPIAPYTLDQLATAVKTMLYQRSSIQYTRAAVKQICAQALPLLDSEKLDLITEVAVLAAREVATLSQVAAVFRANPVSTQYMTAMEQIVTLARGPSLEDSEEIAQTQASKMNQPIVVPSVSITHYEQPIARPKVWRPNVSSTFTPVFRAPNPPRWGASVQQTLPGKDELRPSKRPATPYQEKGKTMLQHQSEIIGQTYLESDYVRTWIQEHANLGIEEEEEDDEPSPPTSVSLLKRNSPSRYQPTAEVMALMKSLREPENKSVGDEVQGSEDDVNKTEDRRSSSSGPEMIPGTQPQRKGPRIKKTARKQREMNDEMDKIRRETAEESEADLELEEATQHGQHSPIFGLK